MKEKQGGKGQEKQGFRITHLELISLTSLKNAPSLTRVDVHQLKLASLHAYKIVI